MASSKTILFTESSMNIGGQELQALQQMRALQLAGFKTLLLCKPNSAILQRANLLGLAATPIRFRNAFHIPSFRQLLHLVRNKDPIAFVSHGSHDALLSVMVSRWAALLGGRRIPVLRVKTFQHGYPLSFAYNHLFSKTLTPSHHLRSLFLVNRSIKPNKIEVLYPGIDFSGLGQANGVLPEHVRHWLDAHPGPVISHGAILRGEKGHRVILNALVEVKKSFPNVRYLIAGEGQDRPLLEAEIKTLGLDDHVYLTGILHEIAPLLIASTLAVLPSLIEPLGMFQIEAQYLGVPTIASRVGGIPETILHEETGLMVEPGKVRAWADAICWVLQHPTEAKQMAERGKAFVTAKFSMERNTVELIKLIQA
jgi:glycosyltransferase involved in cell wall biosynthesis